ncbi:MAG: hypothetical protein PVI21_00235 [Candidatus Woesebacteria bacterium]|jgi:hypothetical protein
MEFMIYTFLAQAYSCDSYGGSAYGECAEAPTPTPSGDSTASGTTTYAADAAETAEDLSTETTEEEQEESQSTTQQQTTYPAETINEEIGWDAILLWSFLGALLIAIIIFLWRRWRRNRLSTFDGGQF